MRHIFPPESTSISKDVLGGYCCTSWEDATADPAGIDVVVLGSGLYGGYCAAKIHELGRELDPKLGLRVVVLEAGPFVLPTHSQNIPNLGFYDPFGDGPENVESGSEPGTRREVWGVGWRSNQPFVGQAYCVGGKSLFWGGWCPRLQSQDLQPWPEAVRDYLTTVDPADPAGFRPIEHVDVATGQRLGRGAALTGYEAVEYEIGVLPVDDFVFDPVQLADENSSQVGLNTALRVFLEQSRANIDSRISTVLPAPIAVQTQSFISGLFSLDKYSSVPGLIGAANTGPRPLALVPNCHVARLECLPSSQAPGRGTRAIQRIVVKHGGSEKTLTIGPHCQVILAMSCIESTRLALESFSLADSGLREPQAELMGRNYMFHVRCDVFFDVDRAGFAAWVAQKWPGKTLANELQLASLHVQCSGQHGRYQYQLYAATNVNGPDSDMYKMVPDLSIQRQIARNFNSDKIRFVLRSSGEVQGGRDFPLGHPDFDYINLAGPADYDKANGHRRAWVQFNRGAHSDDAIWQDMHDTAHAVARALNGGTPPQYGGNYTLEALKQQQGVGTTFHDAGTLWMGDRPDDSVTDCNGHFHHMTNAYCCDQALFTTVGSANPVLTGVALAHRVARDVVGRHAGYQGAAGVGLPSVDLTQGWEWAPYQGMVVLDTSGGGLIETRPRGDIGLYFLPVEKGDFDLAIEWKGFRTDADGVESIPNSGVLLRTPDPRTVDFGNQAEKDSFYEASTEVQIDDSGKQYFKDTGRAIFGSSRHKTGAVYEVEPATQWAANVPSPDGDGLANRYWNTFEIAARGRQITVRLNGRQVCQATVPIQKRLTGFVGLQFHTGRVQFRNLRLS